MSRSEDLSPQTLTPAWPQAFARRCLDAGAIGILFPNITSAAEAAVCVQNCYYPAAEGVSGSRGFGYGGCNEDGAKFNEYAQVVMPGESRVAGRWGGGAARGGRRR